MLFSWVGFWKYSQWSLEFVFVWPMSLVTVAIMVNLAVALIRKWPFRRDRWEKAYWLSFANFLFFPAIIAVAVIGTVAVPIGDAPPPKLNTLAVWTSNGMFFASFLLGVYWVYRMKGLRWFALGLLIVQQWILCGAAFVAAMALSGTWL